MRSTLLKALSKSWAKRKGHLRIDSIHPTDDEKLWQQWSYPFRAPQHTKSCWKPVSSPWAHCWCEKPSIACPTTCSKVPACGKVLASFKRSFFSSQSHPVTTNADICTVQKKISVIAVFSLQKTLQGNTEHATNKRVWEKLDRLQLYPNLQNLALILTIHSVFSMLGF